MRFATAFWTLLALLSVTAPPASAPAEAQQSAPTLQRLLDRFGQMPGMSAEFREEKRIALLSVPVRSEGVLYFAPPGTLMRKVTSPTPSYALLEDGQLTFASQGDRQVVQLDQSPVLSGFVEIFRYVLAGDHQALQRTYRVQYETDGAEWTLTLKPRNQSLARF
ncbi:MAG: outer membrane lipoprotein carrier protein LolA, partial [Gammaproteobacteria bacterium]|nr:outer membrane lipoprotein carrier protein LolA [Gammaproteobacteria bacterium]